MCDRTFCCFCFLIFILKSLINKIIKLFWINENKKHMPQKNALLVHIFHFGLLGFLFQLESRQVH